MKNKAGELKAKEAVAAFILFVLLSAASSWLFYDYLPAMLVFSPAFFLFLKAFRTIKKTKRDEELKDQFIRAVISVSTSLAAGMSPENAFVMAYSDMEKLYGKRSVIAYELGIINTRVAMGIRLCDALYEFAGRENIPEIYDFAVVFSVAKEKGTGFQQVISSCVSVMEDRLRSENEARTMIRARQYEQRIMCIIPPGILIYLRLSSGSFIEALYHNPLGITVMSICLLTYVFAVFISEKIGDVRI